MRSNLSFLWKARPYHEDVDIVDALWADLPGRVSAAKAKTNRTLSHVHTTDGIKAVGDAEGRPPLRATVCFGAVPTDFTLQLR
jgi:hypothetical protein